MRRKLKQTEGSNKMNYTKDIFQSVIKKLPTKYADGDSLLSELYWCYTECNTIDSPELRAQFEKVYHSMLKLSDSKFDQVYNEINKLVVIHERLAFQAGVKIGLCLALELLE